MNSCQHDYDNPTRKGRAHYVCPKCGADISLELALIREAEMEAEEPCRGGCSL